MAALTLILMSGAEKQSKHPQFNLLEHDLELGLIGECSKFCEYSERASPQNLLNKGLFIKACLC